MTISAHNPGQHKLLGNRLLRAMELLESHRHHFEVFDLSSDVLIKAAVIFAIILCIIGFGSKLILGKDEKRLSWVISLFNSGLMSAAGIIYAVMKTRSHHWAALTFGAGGRAAFHTRDNFVVLVCIWFALANFADVAFGVMFYRRQLQFLTAWIHHPVFIWVMYCSTTGDATFAQVGPFAAFFGMVTLEEIPTFLLSLGTVFPACRTDAGFGITFFLFRIAYHIYVGAAAFYADVSIVPKVLVLLTLTLHAFWFSSWVSSYGKYKTKALAARSPPKEKEVTNEFKNE
jgi:hypothetical protein